MKTIGFVLFLAFLGGWMVPGETRLADAPGLLSCTARTQTEQTFVFRRWQLEGAALPDGDFARVSVQVLVETASLSCDWKELEKSIKKKKDYFYVKKFPRASIRIDGAVRQSDGRYLAQAKLVLKGVEGTVPLLFSAVEEGGRWRVSGGGTLDRRSFGFTGDGPQDAVDIRFDFLWPAP
jgi:polyisoprenoid-binding protein YceI